MNNITLRVILGILLFISLYVSPFWLSGFFALIGLIAIPYYYEALAFVACADLLYLGGVSPAIIYVYPIGAASIFIVTQIIRAYLRESAILS